MAMQTEFVQIVQKMNPQYQLLRKWQIEGGISAQVTGLEVSLPDGTSKKLLVRRHGDVDYDGNSNIAAHEFRLLQVLQAEGIPVAKPYYLDESEILLGRPYLVLEFIEGKTEFAPENLDTFLLQIAGNLAKIHSIIGNHENLSFLPERNEIYQANFEEMPANPDDELMEARIRETLKIACPRIQKNPSRLLHGDYWPGNILWKDEQLIAIIDWEDAKLGDPLADLASSRLELLWAFGYDAMANYTRQYQAIMNQLDYENLPYWDLWAALRPIAQFSDWAQDEATRKLWRERHQLFSQQALDILSA